MPMLPLVQNFNGGFVRMDPLHVLAKFEIRSFPHSWDDKGYPKNLGSPRIRIRPFILQFFHGLLFVWILLLIWYDLVWLLIVLAKFEVSSFTRTWDNSDWSLGWDANPNLGEGEAIGGREWCRWKERWWVPIGPHCKLSSICSCFRDIAASVLQHATFSFFPPPPLVSPEFPHVPLDGWRLGSEQRRC